MIKTKDRVDAEQKVENMNYYERAAVYSVIRKMYVLEDVKSLLDCRDLDESLSDDEYNELADTVAERYVYDGKYDCNLSYWTNLDTLIDEEVANSYCKTV